MPSGNVKSVILMAVATLFLLVTPYFSWAEIDLIGKEGKLLTTKGEDFSLTSEISETTSVVIADNVLDLDNKGEDDFKYIGLDYYISLDAKYKDWLNIFASFERNGPYDRDAPILGRRNIPTPFGPMERYQGSMLLPELEHFFVDIRLPFIENYPVHAKAGLFPVMVGNGLAVNGYFENYGASIYHPSEKFAWNLHYERPDWNNRWILGEETPQDDVMGRGYEGTSADFFEADATYTWKEPEKVFWPGGSIQPYVSFLSDRTAEHKRSNLFEIQTEQDLLGTFGADLNLNLKRLSVGFETARNFGKAQSKGGGEDITHKGYFFFWDAAYDLSEVWLTPRASMLYASGNELEGSEEEVLQGSANRAFSVFSPLNYNLYDSVYPSHDISPAVSTANTDGQIFGVARPGTFGDPYVMENLIMPGVGLDFNPFGSEKVTLSFDWRYMAAAKRGVGIVDGETQKLSRDIGHEFNWYANVDVNDHISLSMNFGYFLPGKYYQERREDEGTFFSPLIRSASDVDNAFYGDFRLTFTF